VSLHKPQCLRSSACPRLELEVDFKSRVEWVFSTTYVMRPSRCSMMALVADLTISEVGRQVGLQPSAIRYYERIGILPKAQRVSGQRRYDTTVLNRLAVVQRARLLGFTLDEIRELFFSFRQDTRASARLQKLSQAKLAQLAQLEEEIATVRRLLHRLRENCDCETLDQCGRRLRQKARVPVPCKSATKQRIKGRNHRQSET
jgi:MerR family redox-sensitive transcriptional activator SoxR